MRRKTMKRYLLASIAIAVAAGVMGCMELIFRVELKPKGDKITRTLTVSPKRKSPGVPLTETELTQITLAYSMEKPKGTPNKPTFTGTFDRIMPNDVGGFGRYVRRKSKMGVDVSYFERFRGNDRPGEVLEASRKAIDEITGLIIGYLETQLGKETEFPKLRKFLDTEFRKDLKNITTYMYLATAHSLMNSLFETNSAANIHGRGAVGGLMIYIIEHEYIKTSDIPLIRRASSDKEAMGKFLDIVLTRISAKAGISDATFTARLAALLKNWNKLYVSFDTYLLTTPQYKKNAKAWKPVKINAKRPSAWELVALPLLAQIQLTRMTFYGHNGRIEVELSLASKPNFTNGKWDPKQRTVSWDGPLTSSNKGIPFLPEICFALWSEPDEKFQKARFGKVILTGAKLTDYCIWRNGLTDNEAKLWDGVLTNHKPEKDLAASFKAAAKTAKPMPYVKEGLDMLLNAMRKKGS